MNVNRIRVEQITILLGIFLVFVSANDPNKMNGKKIPSFLGKTLTGIDINRNYFKGKITLINFMNIGCPPCMAEISMLRRFNEEIKNEEFQILCISANTAEQLIGFNSTKDPIYNTVKAHFQVD